MSKVAKRTSELASGMRVIERDHGRNLARLHILDDAIVLVEVISPDGVTVEIDPNYSDIAPFKELIERGR